MNFIGNIFWENVCPGSFFVNHDFVIKVYSWIIILALLVYHIISELLIFFFLTHTEQSKENTEQPVRILVLQDV